jgi:hypothetical protein
VRPTAPTFFSANTKDAAAAGIAAAPAADDAAAVKKLAIRGPSQERREYAAAAFRLVHYVRRRFRSDLAPDDSQFLVETLLRLHLPQDALAFATALSIPTKGLPFPSDLVSGRSVPLLRAAP